MPPLIEEQSGPAFWRSLEERADTPEFRKWVEAEFPSQADKILSPVSRRNFLKVMGASMACTLAGANGCTTAGDRVAVAAGAILLTTARGAAGARATLKACWAGAALDGNPSLATQASPACMAAEKLSATAKRP